MDTFICPVFFSLLRNIYVIFRSFSFYSYFLFTP
nr:MAG TPA: hypothetical protein [Caudoviricetes sp.]